MIARLASWWRSLRRRSRRDEVSRWIAWGRG